MNTTEVINRSGHRLTLKEGNAGVYCTLAEISDGESFTVSFDPNHTYREYWIGATDIDYPLIVPSDEVSECEVITIICNDKGLDCIMTPRACSSPCARSSPLALFLAKFFELFRKTK